MGATAGVEAGGEGLVVGGGRGRGVGGDGATAMGCWLRGRSAWEDEGVQGKGRGVERGRLGAKALRGIKGVRGQVRDRRVRGIRGHHAGPGGRRERRGDWGGGRCVDFAHGGLEGGGPFTLPSRIVGSQTTGG